MLIVLIVTGLVLFVMGWKEFSRSRTFLDGATSGNGEVVDLKYESKSGSTRRLRDHGFRTVYTYATLDGQLHTNSSTRLTSAPEHDVGDSIAVQYRPENPELARIDSFAELWSTATWMSIGGLFFIALGSIGLILAINNPPRQ